MSPSARELRHIVGLSIPVIIAELGWIFMGVVDTIMVGHLGPSAIGAVSIGGILFDAFGIFGIGLVLGLDTLVSQAFGAGRLRQCDHWLWQGLWLSVFVAPMLMLGMLVLPPLMRVSGVHGGVLSLAVPYLKTLIPSLVPLLIYAALRRYLQGMGVVRPVMFALVSANGVNVLGNWLLIPQFGVEGAGWATFWSRMYMAAMLATYTVARNSAVLRHIPRPEYADIRELLRLGVPAAGQILLEVGVFATATVLAGRLHPEALAAHHVVLNIAGTTFMAPLGISSAGAVTVGHAIGRQDARAARRAGWMTLGLGAGIMLLAAAVILLAPNLLLGIFTKNIDVLQIAAPLLVVVAVFQIFDGIQVTATGVLRGAGNTRTPMLANLMGHWLLGLPSGYFLCFVLGFGVIGLWMGLSVGLIAVALALLFVWSRQPL
jgi:MATE family multidrug resistance protein